MCGFNTHRQRQRPRCKLCAAKQCRTAADHEYNVRWHELRDLSNTFSQINKFPRAQIGGFPKDQLRGNLPKSAGKDGKRTVLKLPGIPGHASLLIQWPGLLQEMRRKHFDAHGVVGQNNLAWQGIRKYETVKPFPLSAPPIAPHKLP